MSIELIELQSAHVTQLTDKGVPSDWTVKENNTGKALRTLPSTICDKDMFAVLDFAKHFELKALNAGIQFQKGKQNEVLRLRIKELEQHIAALTVHDEMLAENLENLLTSQER